MGSTPARRTMFPISDTHTDKRKFPLINITVIAATIFIFILQMLALDETALVRSYALVPSLVDFGNLPTLVPFVTAIFLHGGFLHIISNMWFLWVFGDNVESRLGILFPFLYFLSGIVGNFFQYILMPSSDIPMLGASGAVAGVLGAYFILFPHAKIKTLVPFFGFFTFLSVPASFMLGYWFVLQVLSGAVSLPFSGETGGIAFWAHVGGFVTGVVFAKLFRSGERVK